jgi:hypothetical protein
MGAFTGSGGGGGVLDQMKSCGGRGDDGVEGGRSLHPKSKGR